MKNDQYDINTRENVRKSTVAGAAIQRNFSLEIGNFYKNIEALNQQYGLTAPVDEGNTAKGHGKSAKLKYLYAKAGQKANLARADIHQSEQLRNVAGQLLTAQSSELAKRGFAPMQGIPQPRPKPPGFFEQALSVASTAASFINPITSIGGALGVGASPQAAGTWRQRVFQPEQYLGSSYR